MSIWFFSDEFLLTKYKKYVVFTLFYRVFQHSLTLFYNFTSKVNNHHFTVLILTNVHLKINITYIQYILFITYDLFFIYNITLTTFLQCF